MVVHEVPTVGRSTALRLCRACLWAVKLTGQGEVEVKADTAGYQLSRSRQ